MRMKKSICLNIDNTSHPVKKFSVIILCCCCCMYADAQITTPQIKSNFGVDADLSANYFNAAITGNTDDWFHDGTLGSGFGIIDTTGATALLNDYNDAALRNQTVIRNMRYTPFSLLNNSMLIDAVFVRDFHGSDSTIFASGSNKNGMNPSSWSTPVAQAVPDKNEILDVFMHVRREGTANTDSLWMFGGISIENTTGNRYFDFEMYQTDIVYNRAALSFTGYGPDAGHTSWKFDASGNITQPGDIIFTAEYSSAELTLIEPRIWIDKDDMTNVNPVTFNWGSLFDGANSGAQYGYASIVPKTAGAFYSGLQSADNTWGGPFAVVRGDNSVVTDYNERQFMEFAVNLSKLGLDPVTLLGGSTCRMPFRRVMVKTRASTSFTAALKDFVAPFDFLRIDSAEINADVPVFCGVISISNITVSNPVSTSVYEWSTADGHFGDSSNPLSVYVDMPGTYVVTQKLRSVCPVYSTDTVVILFDAGCGVLATGVTNFAAVLRHNESLLSWNSASTQAIKYFEVERSTDGINFTPIKKVFTQTNAYYNATDDVQNLYTNKIYYRLKIMNKTNRYVYSHIISLDLFTKNTLNKPVYIFPNPVKEKISLYTNCTADKRISIYIYDAAGVLMHTANMVARKGYTSSDIKLFPHWKQGMYIVKAVMDEKQYVQKILLIK